ncbi:hypothetical protein JCGZ_20457 [Jatropha curcas]|uniref:Uncharacterized protein n=1 Tax=Jatropha curcas TaxID=180498 RepID=A0A067JMV0_JATCU|nr:hypothetical protein JCGZ_20457 [Jatropha curcas]
MYVVWVIPWKSTSLIDPISGISSYRWLTVRVMVSLIVTILFAVYDGHGGAKVANACGERMHQLVAKEAEKGKLTLSKD